MQCHCMEVGAVPLHGGGSSAIELTLICLWVVFLEEIVFHITTISIVNVCHAMFYSSGHATE